MKYIKATLNEIDVLSKLFDEYRVFYNKESDVSGAKKFLTERISNDESVIFIALNDEGIAIGFVQLYRSFTSTGMNRLWILNDLYVNENYRKLGAGEGLITKCKQLAIETNASGLFLETQNENITAQKLYYKTGFELNNDHSFFYWENK